MHCLEVIVYRNHKATARECGHAVNDSRHETASRIFDTYGSLGATKLPVEFVAAYREARKEG